MRRGAGLNRNKICLDKYSAIIGYRVLELRIEFEFKIKIVIWVWMRLFKEVHKGERARSLVALRI